MTGPGEIPIDDQVALIERELATRRITNPLFATLGLMRPLQAEREIRQMEAVLTTLKRVRDA